MSVPSIKGVAFKGLVEDLQALRACGGVSDAEIEAALTDADRAHLEEQISPGFWYPMESYNRMLDLMVEKEGGPDPVGYLHGRGEGAMKRMLDLGLYRQFDAMEEGWGGRVGAVMTSLGDAVYNFAHWEFLRSDDEEEAAREFAIELTEAEPFSDHALRTIEGAIAMLASRAASGPVDVSVRRPAPDRVRVDVKRR
jgi:hypothetical protein